LAVIGLTSLAGASSLVAIFIAATVYAFGKTFFWPTTLAVVSEQTPKGGALTLNAIGGIGMLAVGILEQYVTERRSYINILRIASGAPCPDLAN
jgi:MFS family permease